MLMISTSAKSSQQKGTSHLSQQFLSKINSVGHMCAFSPPPPQLKQWVRFILK